MPPIGRWGRANDLDFWTALGRGEVHPTEIRAVELLRRTTDPDRFAYYCQTGLLPALGNLTGRIYLIERGGGALELEDGRAVASWCISIGPHRSDIPGTDHVVVLRNFVEGEELAFLQIGNRNPFPFMRELELMNDALGDWFPDLFRTEILDELDDENEDVLELCEFKEDVNIRLQPEALRGFNALPPLFQQNYVGNVNNGCQIAQNIQVDVHQLAQIAPILPPGLGVYLPDGRTIHLDETLSARLLQEHGIRAEDEAERMIEEGYTPEMIVHALNNIVWV